MEYKRKDVDGLDLSEFDPKDVPFESLIGKTIDRIVINDENTQLLIQIGDERYLMYNEYQYGCDAVDVELADICGDLNDLIGSPLLQAEEESNEQTLDDRQSGEVTDWTFYKLATVKGRVTLRWVGTPNVYYSERMNFARLEPRV
jgi:hypothetical protein